jgi:hypothetical protein
MIADCSGDFRPDWWLPADHRRPELLEDIATPVEGKLSGSLLIG